MTDHVQPASPAGQLALFQEEGTQPVPGWRGRTPPEMQADAPEGYRLDLSGEEPLFVVDDANSPCTGGPDDECDDDDAFTDEGVDGYEGDEVEGWFAPREWAPYCADTIGMKGTIRRPTSRLGALWICTGGVRSALDRDKRGLSVYRIVPLNEYRSPHPDLPLPYRKHTALPDDHPFRYGYEGMLVTWQKKAHVLTDEHLVFGHPFVPQPKGHGYIPDPEWFPQDEDAIRSERNLWRDDPNAWQPRRRLI